MRKKIIFLPLFLFIFSGTCFCMDWKVLHETADKTALAPAEEEAAKDPGSLDKQYLLGLVYLNLHRDAEAGRVFERMLQKEPGSIEAEWGKAEVLRRRHDFPAAEKILKKIISSDPGFSPASISLAYIKYFQMDFNGSVRLALKVIQRGEGATDLSNYARAYAMYAGAKGMLAHYGGVFSKAIDGLAVKKNLEKAQRLQPDSPAVLFGLGSFYLLAPALGGGNPSLAEGYLRRAVEVDPLFADAYVRLAQMELVKGNLKASESYFDKAFELDPGNELALDIKNRNCKFICVK